MGRQENFLWICTSRTFWTAQKLKWLLMPLPKRSIGKAPTADTNVGKTSKEDEPKRKQNGAHQEQAGGAEDQKAEKDTNAKNNWWVVCRATKKGSRYALDSILDPAQVQATVQKVVTFVARKAVTNSTPLSRLTRKELDYLVQAVKVSMRWSQKATKVALWQTHESVGQPHFWRAVDAHNIRWLQCESAGQRTHQVPKGMNNFFEVDEKPSTTFEPAVNQEVDRHAETGATAHPKQLFLLDLFCGTAGSSGQRLEQWVVKAWASTT